MSQAFFINSISIYKMPHYKFRFNCGEKREMSKMTNLVKYFATENWHLINLVAKDKQSGFASFRSFLNSNEILVV